MGKRTMISLLVATALVVLGGIIFGGAMTKLQWDFTKLNTNKQESNEYTIAEGYQHISIQTQTADVVILPSETGETKVVCKEQERLKHSVSVSGDTLTIELVDTQTWRDHFFNFATTKVTVYVPAAQLGNISVKNSTGNVSLEDILATGKISIKNSTGNVTFKDCDAGEIYVKNSTGNVKGNFLTEKQFITKVSTGDVKVPDCKTGGRCEIITSTGDVKFTIG